MNDLTQYISSAAVGVSVGSITNNGDEGAYAAGYSAFISAISGSAPTVRDLGDGRAAVEMSPDQKSALSHWLDQQVKGMVSVKEGPDKVEYDLGTVLVPWAVKYTIPVIAGAFVAGWLLKWMIK
jgi:hypothetical protein